jgi:hypothetical protein
LSFVCANAEEVKKENPITDKHKKRGNNFQCFIFKPPFNYLKLRS